jgi:hypothetical protein
VRVAFGIGYRLSRANWKKLYSGNFFNPIHEVEQVSGSKIMIFHAKDDPYVPWRPVERFAKPMGATLKLLSHGGLSKPSLLFSDTGLK